MAEVRDERGQDVEWLLQENRELRERTAQLETALESRIVIEQAKGVLSARHGLDIERAFDVLRRGARSHQLKLHDLAGRVVAEPRTPDEIAALLDRA